MVLIASYPVGCICIDVFFVMYIYLKFRLISSALTSLSIVPSVFIFQRACLYTCTCGADMRSHVCVDTSVDGASVGGNEGAGCALCPVREVNSIMTSILCSDMCYVMMSYWMLRAIGVR